MYIDETGGLWLSGPGGVVLALTALGLVLWAQSGLRLTALARLLARRRAVEPRRRGGVQGRRLDYGPGRSGVGARRVGSGSLARPAAARPALMAVPGRTAGGRAAQRAGARDDRSADLQPVA